MTWGPRYRDRILEDAVLPSLEAYRLSDRSPKAFPTHQITLGGLTRSAGTEMGLWRKLLSPLSLDNPLFLWLGVEEDFVESMTPGSLQDFTFLADGSSWTSVLRVNEGVSCFALLTNTSGRRLVFLGLPTEEGLDLATEFLA